jgi:hypothetical protein
MASGRQTRRNTEVAESSHANEMDPWKDDRCRDFTCLNVARRLLEFHTGVPAPRSLDAKYVTHPESLPQIDCLGSCRDRCKQYGGRCVLAEAFTGVFGEVPLDHAHSTHTAGSRAATEPPAERNLACCKECTEYMANYFLDLLARGVVLDRLNVRELSFANWALAPKGGITDAVGGQAVPTAHAGRKELLVITLRNSYYELLKRPKTRPVPPEGHDTDAHHQQQQSSVSHSLTLASVAVSTAPAASKPQAPTVTAPQTRLASRMAEERQRKAREAFGAALMPAIEGMIGECDEALACGAVCPPQLAQFSFSQRCLLVLGASRMLDPVCRSGRGGPDARPCVKYASGSAPYCYWK